jgi:hypothetical protein
MWQTSAQLAAQLPASVAVPTVTQDKHPAEVLNDLAKVKALVRENTPPPDPLADVRLQLDPAKVRDAFVQMVTSGKNPILPRDGSALVLGMLTFPSVNPAVRQGVADLPLLSTSQAGFDQFKATVSARGIDVTAHNADLLRVWDNLATFVTRWERLPEGLDLKPEHFPAK